MWDENLSSVSVSQRWERRWEDSGGQVYYGLHLQSVRRWIQSPGESCSFSVVPPHPHPHPHGTLCTQQVHMTYDILHMLGFSERHMFFTHNFTLKSSSVSSSSIGPLFQPGRPPNRQMLGSQAQERRNVWQGKIYVTMTLGFIDLDGIWALSSRPTSEIISWLSAVSSTWARSASARYLMDAAQSCDSPCS